MKKEIQSYDFIIAGAGLSGLSMLVELIQQPRYTNANYLIIDLDEKKSNDRTWSFWTKSPEIFAEIPHRTWSKANVIDRNGEIVSSEILPYTYMSIKGFDYYKYVFDQYISRENVTFVNDRILACDEDGYVHCAQDVYIGKTVFKSYFEKEDIVISDQYAFLWQHFKGWIIKTNEPAFDPTEATLMDYRIADNNETKFFYVLPYSSTTALVEYTEFSRNFLTQENYDLHLSRYIEKYLQIEHYQIEEVEFSAIPMTDYPFDQNVRGKVIQIGTMAGYVKASSGYAFVRTHEKNKLLAKRLADGKKITNTDIRSSYKYSLYDAAMLSILYEKKLFGYEVFVPLFKKLTSKKVFKFLDEKTSLIEDLEIMNTVPKKHLFIWAVMKKLSSIFSK